MRASRCGPPLEEVVAVELGVEAEDARAEQALEDLLAHGQMPNRSAFGHGMCQKVMIVASGSRSRIIRGSEREVVVLHEDDGIRRSSPPRTDRVGEAAVHRS
jgi:hypothetical protein